MKAVLISIRPKWCELIANGKKTLEVRKTKPKMLNTPFKCYIYCTNTGRPLVLGDVFRGNWETEYVQTYGRSRAEADKIWGIMNGTIIGEFVCDKVHLWSGDIQDFNTITLKEASKASCVSEDDLLDYADGSFFGWHISDLVIYDTPKPVSAFCVSGTCDDRNCEICPWTNGKFYTDDNHCKVDEGKKPLFRPPQSWCYVEEVYDET